MLAVLIASDYRQRMYAERDSTNVLVEAKESFGLFFFALVSRFILRYVCVACAR